MKTIWCQTETIAGQAPAWDRGMLFESGSLRASSSGINPIFNENSGTHVKSLFRCLYLIFVFSQSFEALPRCSLCGVSGQETGL